MKPEPEQEEKIVTMSYDEFIEAQNVARGKRRGGIIGRRGEANRSCIRQTYTIKDGVARVRYLHATKGWRDRIDIGFVRPADRPLEEMNDVSPEQRQEMIQRAEKEKLLT